MGIGSGEPVTQSSMIALRQQMDNLPFVSQRYPPALVFIQGKTILRVYVDNKQASSFDILAGFRPASQATRTIIITGYAELDLVNQLNRGERIYLHLERLKPRSQEVEIRTSYPNLLDLPFGVEGEFRLMKNDTFYSDLHWKAGVVFPLDEINFSEPV